MPEGVRAYIDLLSTDEVGERTVTLVVEYDGKTARLDLGLGVLADGEEPVAEIVRREVRLLVDALEAVDASVEGILAARPSEGTTLQVETSGAPRADPVEAGEP